MASFLWPLVVLSQLFAVAMVVTMVIWLRNHVTGFVWGSPGGYHPLLLTSALVFLFGEALLSFRVFSRCRVPYLAQKAIHATIHAVTIVLTIAGLRAATLAKERHTDTEIVHNYSIHSWLGIGTLVLFYLQFLAGCIYYGSERYLRQDHPLRAQYPQIHAFFGVFVLALSVTSCLTGLNELSIYEIPSYSTGVLSGTIGNLFGFFMVVFCGLISFIITRPAYKISQNPTADTSSNPTAQQEILPVVISDDVANDVTDGLQINRQERV